MEIELQSYIKQLCKKFENALPRELKWLVIDILGETKADKLVISQPQEEKIFDGAKKLNEGMPLAYVLHKMPFYDCVFYVDNNVLIPRFETEELALKVTNYAQSLISSNAMQQNPISILDMCSGSGCIAISIKKHVKICNVTAAEIDKNNCKIIEKNAKMNDVQIDILQTDMFKNVQNTFDIIVSNPPYIESDEIKKLHSSVKDFEPHLALDGGIDGLNFYREIAQNAHKFLNKDGMLFLEIGYNQGKTVPKLLEQHFTDIKVYKDLSGQNRMISAKKRG